MSQEIFDYVIVGAGSAGSVLANRLSAQRDIRVLLLEAGGEDNHHWVHIPLGIGRMLTDSRFVWPFSTEAEPELGNQTVYWPRGRMLGGSSSVNGMIYARGSAQRYDEWRDGNSPGWGFDELLPYFKKIEDRPDGDPDWRGSGGPVTVTGGVAKDRLSQAFMQACIEAGTFANPDYNGARFEGASWLQYNIRRGRRCSAADAYLHPVRRRSNLVIRTRALACRVLLEGRRAVGVRYRQNGAEHDVSARREVLLAAGPIVSPKLLELSGIGDGEHLRRFEIDVAHHLPGVGENLQDHLQARLTYESKLPCTVNDILNNRLRGAAAALRYAFRRDGLLASTPATVHAIMRSREGLSYADIKLQIMLVSGKDRYAHTKALGVDSFSGFNIGVFQLYPHSAGSVHIQSPDPEQAPKIHANYLSDARDAEVLLRGLRKVREVASRPVFARHVVREVRPGPEADSDEALLEYARQTAQTSWHPISTCRMGRGGQDVVDYALRVHGMQNLRIIDSSIMPNMPSSNTNVPSIMIGEKGADLVLADAAGRDP